LDWRELTEIIVLVVQTRHFSLTMPLHPVLQMATNHMLARAIGQKLGKERGLLNTMESGTKSTNADHFSPEGFNYPTGQFILAK